MKKTFRKLTASLTAALMIFSSTYTHAGSVSASSDEIQPRGAWYVYGDVNNDGVVEIADATLMTQFMTLYKNQYVNALISIEDAEKFRGEYYLPVPQAADIDGDGYITDANIICIMCYDAKAYDRAGRCGQPFFIK